MDEALRRYLEIVKHLWNKRPHRRNATKYIQNKQNLAVNDMGTKPMATWLPPMPLRTDDSYEHA
eukprot:6118593-Amphidinium_carterae.1